MLSRHLAGLTLGGLAAALLLMLEIGVSKAQEPERPEQPPPEAISCVRLTDLATELAAPSDFTVTLDEERKRAVFSVGAVPNGVTCYAVFKTPSPVNPIAFAWDDADIAVPREFFDESGFATSGRYCYQLFLGNASGYSASAERCIDVPTTVAPPPEPAPDLPTPEPPFLGSGFAEPESSSMRAWATAVGVGVVTSLLALAVVAKLNRAS